MLLPSLIVLILAPQVLGDCQSDYESSVQDYLLGKFKSEASRFEQEYFKSFVKQIKKCMPKEESKDYCSFDDFDTTGRKIYDRKECPLCNALSRTLINELIRKSSGRKCFEKRMVELISREVRPCVVKKLGKDFDQFQFDIFEHRSSSKTMPHHAGLLLMVKAKLDKCKEESITKWQNSYKCFNDMGTFVRPTHCKSVDECATTKKKSCPKSLEKVHKAICECSNERRMVLVSDAKAVKGLIPKMTDPDDCLEKVEKQMNLGEVNWYKEMDSMLTECSDDKLLHDNLPNLLSSGCYLAVSERPSSLLHGIAIVAHFMESFSYRYTRFCTCD